MNIEDEIEKVKCKDNDRGIDRSIGFLPKRIGSFEKESN